jgi:hypothetical protein
MVSLILGLRLGIGLFIDVSAIKAIDQPLSRQIRETRWKLD